VKFERTAISLPHARLELIADHTNSMSKAKLNIAVAAIAVFLISTILCAWTTWHYASNWLNPPPNTIARDASSPEIAVPTVAPVLPAADTGLGGKFLGTWTGHWDNKLAARFTISRKNDKQLMSIYESEDSPGRTMSKKILHPWANDHVLNMPRASITLTLSDTLPNTAHGEVSIKAGDITTVRTATFVRGGDLQVTNWLPGDGSAPATNQPIVLDIKATIDGSDILNLSPNGALWSHQTYQWPTDISVNGIAWDAHTQPILTSTGLGGSNLTTAKVISHSGRDRVEMVTTPTGIAINFEDSPPGSAPYEIKIRLNPR
jgi:hypothetical protein